MKRLNILQKVLRYTKADKILLSYLAFVFVDALVIWLVDPAVTTYRDSIWFCCAVISTVGFGDVVATTFISRIATILLMMYSVLVVAIVTGVVVNYYNQLIKIRQDESITALLDKLERLPELPKEELQEISEKISNFQKNH